MTTTRSRLPPSWRGPLLCTGKRKVRLGLCLSLFCNLKISILKRFNLHVAIWPHVRCSLPCLYYHFCLSVLIHTDSLTAEANWRSPRPKRDMISAKRISRAMWVTFALLFLLTIFSPYWIVYHLRLLWSQKSVFLTVHNSSRHFFLCGAGCVHSRHLEGSLCLDRQKCFRDWERQRSDICSCK